MCRFYDSEEESKLYTASLSGPNLVSNLESGKQELQYSFAFARENGQYCQTPTYVFKAIKQKRDFGADVDNLVHLFSFLELI